MFATNKADDMIRLLKLFRSQRLTDQARQELARSIQALAAELVITDWPRLPMPPYKPATSDGREAAHDTAGTRL